MDRAERRSGAPGVATDPVGDELADALAWLDDHTNYELAMPTRLGAPTLDRIRALCHILGNPERTYPVIHLTGTNGKGSTARLLTELLSVQGLSVGTYTSPNLVRVNERLSRNGEPIPDLELVEVLDALRSLEDLVPDRLTRFELLTAAAFRWFADVAVDVAVVEVGLGGRWDATNVVDPDVCAVTNVSFDHVEVLGPTLVDIAREKAGIIKAGCRVVVGETAPELESVFADAAETTGAVEAWYREVEFACLANRVAVGGRLLDLRTPAARYEDVFLALHGRHQGDNAAVALAAAEAFFGTPLSADVVNLAFGRVVVRGRLEVVGREPLVLLDGAHNVAGAEALGVALQEEFTVEGPSVAVVGMLAGRDPRALLRPLVDAGVTTVVACPAPSPRSLPAAAVADAARAEGVTAQEAASPEEALALALPLAGTSGMVLVCGSLYVVAAVRPAVVGGVDGPVESR